MKKKIVHVGKMDKFILPFHDFIKEEAASSEHKFFFFRDANKFNGELGGRKVTVDNLKDLINLEKEMLSADKIILHSMFSQQIFFLLLIQPWLLKKCFWFMWGGDLYYKFIHHEGLKTVVLEFLRSVVLKKINHVVSGVEGDYELMKKLYNPMAKFHECLGYESNIFRSVDEKRQDPDNINILVGNSATETNNHLELFTKLKPLITPGMKLYVPLSYGDMKYSQQIIHLGNEMFGSAFEPLTQFMPFNDYLKFLNKIDIAVLGHDRQQAFGNTVTLLGYGKKVFMKDTVTPWQTFERLGVKVFDLNKICLDPHFSESEQNVKLIKDNFSREKLAKQWKDLIDY